MSYVSFSAYARSFVVLHQKKKKFNIINISEKASDNHASHICTLFETEIIVAVMCVTFFASIFTALNDPTGFFVHDYYAKWTRAFRKLFHNTQSNRPHTPRILLSLFTHAFRFFHSAFFHIGGATVLS